MRCHTPFLWLALLTAACNSPPQTLDPGGDIGAQAEAMLAALPWAEQLGESHAVQVRTDDLGMTHVRLRQTWRGHPVLGGEAIVHYAADGSVRAVTDHRLRSLRAPTQALLTEADALQRALDAVELTADLLTRAPIAALLVLRHAGTDHLAWSIQRQQLDETDAPTMPRVFVDARTGEIIRTLEELHTAHGTSTYSGEVSFETFATQGTHFLEDPTRRIGTYTFRNGTSRLYPLADGDDVWTGDPAAVDVHFAAQEVTDYLAVTFGRDGIDGAGGPGYMDALSGGGPLLSMMVHYSERYNNAFFAGDAFIFGDGDGTTFGPLTALDVVAHELGHGVNAAEAGFLYADESGALDEGIADVLAALAERHTYGDSADTYRIGEDCYTPGVPGDALRYLYSPALDGSSPDHYTEHYTGDLDNGGVHINAGIVGLAFYLMAEGGSHPTGKSSIVVQGVGPEVAAQVWYRALSHYMTASTDFVAARQAILSAAADLYGADSAAWGAAANAWHAVGVGEAVEPPAEEPEEDSGTDTDPPSDSGPDHCEAFARQGAGNLRGAEDFDLQLDGASYHAAASGEQRACVLAPPDAEVMLVALMRTGPSWRVVDYAISQNGAVELSIAGAAGSEYTWLVAAQDAGEEGFTYQFGLEVP